MGDGVDGSRQSMVADGWVFLREAGGAVPVAVVLTIIGVAVRLVRTDDLIVSRATWQSAGALAFILAAVAVAVGIARAVIAVRRSPRTPVPVPRGAGVRWPRAETVGLIVLGLAYGAVVAWVFVGPPPCEDLPDGSDRTACAMGVGMLYILLVFGGLFVWVVGSVILSLVWVVRTAMDARVMLHGGPHRHDSSDPSGRDASRGGLGAMRGLGAVHGMGAVQGSIEQDALGSDDGIVHPGCWFWAAPGEQGSAVAESVELLALDEAIMSREPPYANG